MSDTQSLDEIVIVIEAASLLPSAVYTLLAKEGAHLILLQNTDEERVLSIQKEIEHSVGGKCLVLDGDLEDPTFKEEISKTAQEEFNTTHILFLTPNL